MGITASSFKLRANDPEGRKANSYQRKRIPISESDFPDLEA
jgi:hypothetical protein